MNPDKSTHSICFSGDSEVKPITMILRAMLWRPNLGIKFELSGYQRKQNSYKSYKFKASVSDPKCSLGLWLEVQILSSYPWSYPKTRSPVSARRTVTDIRNFTFLFSLQKTETRYFVLWSAKRAQSKNCIVAFGLCSVHESTSALELNQFNLR